jgi:hypothetical protein
MSVCHELGKLVPSVVQNIILNVLCIACTSNNLPCATLIIFEGSVPYSVHRALQHLCTAPVPSLMEAPRWHVPHLPQHVLQQHLLHMPLALKQQLNPIDTPVPPAAATLLAALRAAIAPQQVGPSAAAGAVPVQVGLQALPFLHQQAGHPAVAQAGTNLPGNPGAVHGVTAGGVSPAQQQTPQPLPPAAQDSRGVLAGR